MLRHRTAANRREAVRLFSVAALSGGALIATSPLAAAASMRRHAFAATGIEKGCFDMAQDLAMLTAAHFEPLIGHVFTIGDHQVTLRDVHRAGRPTPAFREQFSLVFSLPPQVLIGSQVLPVEHPAFGRCDLLVTQVIDAAEGTALEICFS